ncbi:MAG: AMP-binding protein [Chlamydiales bacterium]|nr:AMP-binding protein [Chlamydiales bacterium]
MLVYTKESSCSTEDYSFYPLLAYDGPIVFLADNSIKSLSLILFLFEHKKSFFPVNPELPKAQVDNLVLNVKGVLFDQHANNILYASASQDPTLYSLYLLTTGTTNKPKIVVLSFDNIYYSALGSIQYFALTSQDTWQLSIPLFHIGGLMLLFRMLYVNGSIALVNLKESFFHPKTSFTSLVPTQLYRFLQASIFLPTHIKGLLIGGAACQEALINHSKAASLPIHLTYGMTEMCSQITCGYYRVGSLLAFRELHIANDGEILVKGECLFQGYLNENNTLRAPTDVDGYFHTNDIGTYSVEKGLSIIGRKDRQFISGGENIQPEEIESIMTRLFNLTYCKIEPIPCEEFGMRAIAHLLPFPPLTPVEMKSRLKDHLPGHKIPKEFQEAIIPKNFKNLG